MKLYADTRRLANVPNADFPRSNKLFVQMEARDNGDNAVYVTRIRVAESQKTIYDALASTGKWATQGILFETGKAEVRPEASAVKLITRRWVSTLDATARKSS